MMRLPLVCLTLFFMPATLARANNQVSNTPQVLSERAQEDQRGSPRLFDRLATSVARSNSRVRLNENSGIENERHEPEENSDAVVSELAEQAASSFGDRGGLAGNLGLVLSISVMSLAPAILLMTTCYVRVVVVLGLLRQALGTGQLPPTQVLTSISVFITMFVMSPVWTSVYHDAVKPYTQEGSTMAATEAWELGTAPIREFMFQQIEHVGNDDDIYLFYHYHNGSTELPKYREDIPFQVLLPAYMLSELKTAFLMGFMIFMPFLVIDLVVASVTTSMGMMMLPPAMVSLPFKLLLFVLVDGWHLIVEMLLSSFGTVG